MSVQSDKKVFHMVHMLRNIAVKYNKNLAKEEKDIKKNSVGHNLGKRLNLLLSRIKVGHSRIMRHRRTKSAGPAAKAEERNRGARIAVSQKPRPGRPQYSQAVTVWMLTAKGIEMYIRGLTHIG